MRTLLFFLTALGSGLCWWPVIVEPGLDLPSWIPLASAASTGLPTILHRARWPLFLLASGLGTFSGLSVAYMIWWPTDPIAETWVPYSVAAVTLAAVIVSLVAALAARYVVISHATWRRAVWVVLSGCVAFGPLALALTPPLVRLAKGKLWNEPQPTLQTQAGCVMVGDCRAITLARRSVRMTGGGSLETL